MVTSQIKTAKNGYKYLKIEKNGKSFCIFETEDYLILDIAHKIDAMPTLEGIQKGLNDDTYNIFFYSHKEKNDLKESYYRMDHINNYFVGLCNHDKPDFHYILNKDIEEDTIFEDEIYFGVDIDE